MQRTVTTPATSLARNSVGTLRSAGLGALFSKAVGRISESVFATNAADWYCADVSAEFHRVSRPTGATIDFDDREGLLAWLAELQPSFPWVWDEHEVADARVCGHALPLMRINGDRAGFIMVGLSRAYVTDFQRSIDIPAQTAFIYDTFVHPNFRGRGLAAWAITQTIDFLRHRDMRFLWCHIPVWNRASIRSFEKCGFTKVAHVRYLRLLGTRWLTRNPERLMKHRETIETAV